MINLGEKIKIYRKRSGLTLQKLADLSGLSPSFISKFESGKVGISIANLDRISDVLGLSSLLLLDDAEIKYPYISRNNERSRFFLNGNIFYEDLSPSLSTFSISSSLIYSNPGEKSGEKTKHLSGDEIHLVIRGKYKYCVEDEEFILNEGDSICHRSTDLHSWENIGDIQGILLAMASPSAVKN
jgi:transcriptional regulator with XRE-family HTH domain